ncbi:Kazal-type serine protease inhibitor family protein [Hymenobacter persicinus]|uniref:Kazal-type serine protease inhibitor family protein n=1 Tax=Hymenobacter persicinus TaxID=2025506 RepID=A0A4Q5LF09_9BACT|nr:Kazal-type serine protease inhibitor [Hymenobacter persicinus]RYU82860.1 Kazal-type serine protease inhibitor family protein [Hymenobacter persicinus]
MKQLFLFSLLLLTGACAKETPNPTAPKAQTSTNVKGDDTQCLDVYDPVCSNGVTYPNACYAQKAGVTSYTRGACDGSGGDI